jgi:hypothetical protein
MPAFSPEPCAEQTSDKTREAGVGSKACANAGASTPTSMASRIIQVPWRCLDRKDIMQSV